MNAWRLVARSLVFYWRSSVLTALCVAVAAAVIVGSLTVGASVKASLRERTVGSLGGIKSAIVTKGSLRSSLAETTAWNLKGTLADDRDNSIPGVEVWGVPTGFQGLPLTLNRAILSESLASEMGAKEGARLFLTVPKPSAAPLGSLFGRKRAEDATTEVPIRVGAIIPDQGIGSFSLQPNFGKPRGLFIDRDWLAKRLGQSGRANVLLASHPIDLRSTPLDLDDLGLVLRPARSAGGWVLTSRSVLLTAPQLRAIRSTGLRGSHISICLLDRLSVGTKSSAYAMAAWAEGVQSGVLNQWAAADLKAKKGDSILVDALQPRKDGGVTTVSLRTVIAATDPMNGLLAEPAIVPELEGMTNSTRMDDWEPPFSIDLARITTRDERYWELYRAAPRVLLDAEFLRKAWGGGDYITGVWFPRGEQTAIEAAILKKLRPEDSGFAVIPLREQAEKAAEGSSDIGGLMLGLGAFVVIGALALAGTVLSMNVQARAKQFALMFSLGVRPGTLVVEGLLVAAIGSVVGVPLGIFFASGAVRALQRLMPTAMGFSFVQISVDFGNLAIGLVSSFVVSAAGLLVVIRRLRRSPIVTTLRGGIEPKGSDSVASDHPSLPQGGGSETADVSHQNARWKTLGHALGWLVLGVVLIVASILAREPGVRSLIASGAVLCVGLVLVGSSINLQKTAFSRRRFIATTLDRRFLLLSTLLIASASLVLLIVVANLQDRTAEKQPYNLFATTTAPIGIDLSSTEGRMKLGFRDEAPYQDVRIVPLKRSPGDDASCLNLAKPAVPRIIAATPEVLEAFDLSTSDEAIPLYGDTDTVQWTLHSGIGKDYTIGNNKGKVVGLTHGRFLAGDLLTTENAFHLLFPEVEGSTLFLVQSPEGKVEEVANALRSDLKPFGVDVRETGEEASRFHQVQNAYLSLFLALGLFSLLLALIGVSLLAFRRAVERKSEFALLLALGFPRTFIGSLAVVESLVGTGYGVLLGVAASGAGIAFGGVARWSFLPVAVTALALILVSLATSTFVAKAFLRARLVEALRTE